MKLRTLSNERRNENAPGTYALVLRAPRTISIRVGRLGPLDVRRGYYVYVGSAFGPGGVAARVGRHRSGAGRPRWHIDALRCVTRLVEVWITHDPIRREHDWAAAARGDLGGHVPLRGFGSSDCRCEAHLFRFPRRPSGEAFARCLAARHPGHAAVSVVVDSPRAAGDP